MPTESIFDADPDSDHNAYWTWRMPSEISFADPSTISTSLYMAYSLRTMGDGYLSGAENLMIDSLSQNRIDENIVNLKQADVLCFPFCFLIFQGIEDYLKALLCLIYDKKGKRIFATNHEVFCLLSDLNQKVLNAKSLSNEDKKWITGHLRQVKLLLIDLMQKFPDSFETRYPMGTDFCFNPSLCSSGTPIAINVPLLFRKAAISHVLLENVFEILSNGSTLF